MKRLVLMSIPASINAVRKNILEYANGVAILLLIAGFISCDKRSSFDFDDSEDEIEIIESDEVESEEDSNQNIDYYTDNEHIKYVSLNGAILDRYFYDHSGKIVKYDGRNTFKKYIYDDDEKLIKEVGTNSWSFLTNPIDHYALYTYDKDGRLSKMDYYSNESRNGFEHRTTQTFEHDGKFIIKIMGETVYYPEPSIGIDVFTYDDHGNVASKKHFSCIPGDEPELSFETNYIYDSYINPYRIFSMSGNPGLYTNVNNIVETTTIYHGDYGIYDGIVNKTTVSKTSYQYNENGYPIKVKTDDGVEFEYHY